MKKTKLFSLLIFVLLASLLLSSCSNKRVEKTLDAIFNDDHSSKPDIFTKATLFTDLEGYSPVSFVSNIVVAEQHRNGLVSGDVHESYKVYNLLTESVVLELTDKSFNYTINTDNTENYYFVVKYRPVTASSAIEYVAYDLMGNELARSAKDFEPAISYDDYVLFNQTVYNKDTKNGSLEKISSVPEYAIPSGKMTDYKNGYIYFTNASDIVVYDTVFEQVFYYSLPSYIENHTYEILNNGNIFAQGSICVENDAKEYDYYVVGSTETKKYNIYQALIDPIKKSVKELDLGYMVRDITTSSSESDNPVYNSEGFENIAYLYPIVDKNIDTSAANQEMVFMSNDAKILKSAKVLEGQSANLPTRINSDRYLIPMIDRMYTLIDANGTVIASGIYSPSHTSEYIISNNVVYDLDMKLIYNSKDLPEGTGARVWKTYDTIFICESTDTLDAYYTIKNGAKQHIGSRAHDVGRDINALETHSFGYFFKHEDKITIYNYNGDVIFEKSNPSFVVYVSSTDDAALIYFGREYYLITK